MAAQQKLFDLPRRAQIKRMHVNDAGSDMVELICGHCGHNAGWVPCKPGGGGGYLSLTEAKRGVPCPNCNLSENA